MTTYFLDFIGGGDTSHDGKSFANRGKDWYQLDGIVAGDEVRVMATPDPTLVGDVAWTTLGDTVTLPSAVTLAVADLSTAMTASTNVTAAAVSDPYTDVVLGDRAKLTISASFGTGKLAYLPLPSTLDLSAYQQISLWYRYTGTAYNMALELRLCSDAAGATAVHTIPLDNAVFGSGASASGTWLVAVKDFGANLGTNINSIAIYAGTGGTAPGASTLEFNNIVACKARSAADSLTHDSLIAKVHAQPWQASTAYASGDTRKPTITKRNGLGYTCTTPGTSGSTEPTWPDKLGATVGDGSVVWTCSALEEPWFSIVNLNGTTVTLEEHNYPGATETVATYKRQPAVMGLMNVGTNGSGTLDSWITMSGGWDTTTMTSRVGETWLSARNLPLWMMRKSNYSASATNTSTMSGQKYWEVSGLHFRRFGYGVNPYNAVYRLRDMSFGSVGVAFDEYTYGSYSAIDFSGVKFQNCPHPVRWCGSNLAFDKGDFIGGRSPSPAGYPAYRANIDSTDPQSAKQGEIGAYSANFKRCRFRYCNVAFLGGDPLFTDCDFDPNGDSWVDAYGTGTILRGANIYDAFGSLQYANYTRSRMRLQDCPDAPAAAVVIVDGSFMIQSDATTTHSGTGLAWKYIASDPWGSIYPRLPQNPVTLVVGKIYAESGTSKAISIWGRRDSTSTNARLVIRGGQLPGVDEQIIDINPSTLDTWEQSAALTVAPSASGVVEVEVWFDSIEDPDYEIRNFWVDDLTVV